MTFLRDILTPCRASVTNFSSACFVNLISINKLHATIKYPQSKQNGWLSYGTAVLSPVFTLNRTFTGAKSELVAGAGIAPAPSGYEPDEVLLLHPAMYCFIKILSLSDFKYFSFCIASLLLTKVSVCIIIQGLYVFVHPVLLELCRSNLFSISLVLPM